MAERILSEETVFDFHEYLVLEEKSTATVEKYLRDVRAFHLFLDGQPVTKEQMMAYKKSLLERGYAVNSINSMLASLNSLLAYLGWTDCKVKNVKTQHKTYCTEDKELTKSEYLRLLDAAKAAHPNKGFVEVMIHEQYFYPAYKAYLPDYAQRIFSACRWCRENGYTPAFTSGVLFE